MIPTSAIDTIVCVMEAIQLLEPYEHILQPLVAQMTEQRLLAVCLSLYPIHSLLFSQLKHRNIRIHTLSFTVA